MPPHKILWIIVLFGIMVFTTGTGLAREDPESHVKRKCEEKNLPYYKVNDRHYCCGCRAGQHVSGDCRINYQNTTRCEACPYDATNRTYTSEANTQRWCNIAKTPAYCLNFMNTKFVEGSSDKDASCQCIDETFASDPEKNGCAMHRICPPMFSLSREGNSTHDVECTRCAAGLCTYNHSNTQVCQPCNSSNTIVATTPYLTTTALAKPSDEYQTQGKSNVLYLFICAVVSFILGVLVGHFVPVLRRQWRKKRSKNSESISAQSNIDPAQQPLMHESPGSPTTQDTESVNAFDSRANISSGRGSLAADGHETRASSFERINEQVRHSSPRESVTRDIYQRGAANNIPAESIKLTTMPERQPPKEPQVVDTSSKAFMTGKDQIQKTEGRVSETPEMCDKAGTHRTDEIPMKGPAKTVEQDRYSEEFLNQGYRIEFEPNNGVNCLLLVILKVIQPHLSYSDLERAAIRFREDLARFVSANKMRLRQSILRAGLQEDDYIRKLRDGSQPSDEIMVEAVALMQNCTINIVYTGGAPKRFYGSTNDESNVLYVGYVERYHFVLLKPTYVRKDGDPEASSNTVPVADIRLESRETQAVANQSVTTDTPPSRAQVSTCDGTVSESGRQSAANYMKPPEQLRTKSDWDFFDSRDQKPALLKCMQRNPELDVSSCLEDGKLAKAMLTGDPPLLPNVDSLVKHRLDTHVTPLVRLPGLITNPSVLLNDALHDHPNAQNRRYHLVDGVINELGMRLTPRLLLDSAKQGRNKVLQRFFSDYFVQYVQLKYPGSSPKGPGDPNG